MKRKQALPELLAPAGDYDALVAAVLGGADAVYVGGRRFGARAYAKNFDGEELSCAIRFCHLFGVRLYVTLNTLILDKEVDEALEYAKTLHAMGVDALIVADVGIAALIKKTLPELELHASTQMGVHNTKGADFAYKLGCNRVVLARECSAKDVSAITANSLADCEVFVHGALCVCHSGQCLMSSMVGARSGNRGECAQPCRLPYNSGKYVLSLNDLSLAEHINELIDSGVASLKIEGRMKSPTYVYEVTSIYRKLLDTRRSASADEKKRLSDVFSRGGVFTDGYFVSGVRNKMTGVRTDSDKKASKDLTTSCLTAPKCKIRARASFRSGEPCTLTFTTDVHSLWDERGAKTGEGYTYGQISVTVSSDVPAPAENAPLTHEGVCERLAKLGNTPFILGASDIELVLDERINLAPSKINELRRECAAKLVDAFGEKLDNLCGNNRSTLPRGEFYAEITPQNTAKRMRTALFFSPSLLTDVFKKARELIRGLDILFVPLHSRSEAGDAGVTVTGVYLPPIIMEHEWQEVCSELKNARAKGIKYALIGNVSQIELAVECGMIPIGDFRLNVTNGYASSVFRTLGVRHIIMSAELTVPQARDIGGGVITLGRIPLMITERCFIRENFGCERCGRACLRDRLGSSFPMMREYSHRNVIFNSTVTYMGDKREELRRAGLLHEHFIFSTERAEECIALMSAYQSGERLSVPHRRLGKRETPQK